MRRPSAVTRSAASKSLNRACAEAEVAVEGVDQDLEGALQRIGVEALGLRRGGAHARLRPEPAAAQVVEQREEHAQVVALRADPPGEHERGVERPDVAVVDPVDHAGLEHVGVAARERARCVRQGHGAVLGVVRAQHERVDLRRVAAHAHGLVAEGQDLRLGEKGGREQGGDRRGLRDIVAQVGLERGGILAEDARDLGALDVGAVRGRDAEVARHLLEPETRQRPVADVVGLHEEVRVDDRPAGDLETLVVDRALPDGEAARPRAGRAAVPPEAQLDLVAARPRRDVRQIEVEQVVPLDDVGVPLAHEGREAPEQRRLVVFRAGEHLGPTGVVGEAYGKDAVPLARGVGEVVAGFRGGLDVELQPPDVVEGHPAEARLARGDEELLHGVVEREPGSAGRGRPLAGPPAQPLEHAAEVLPGREGSAYAQRPGTVEGHGFRLRGGALEEPRILRPEEGAEGVLRGAHARRVARADGHALGGGGVGIDGHDAGLRVGTEDKVLGGKHGRLPAGLSRPTAGWTRAC